LQDCDCNLWLRLNVMNDGYFGGNDTISNANLTCFVNNYHELMFDDNDTYKSVAIFLLY